MTDHELNLAIARMMPGWTETKENKPPCWFEYGDKIILFRSERDQTVWSPATDLNQAAEAVWAICDTPAKVVAWRSYIVETWDPDLHRFTPQNGVPRGPYSKWGLRTALRKLREMGYGANRSDTFVLVKRKAERS